MRKMTSYKLLIVWTIFFSGSCSRGSNTPDPEPPPPPPATNEIDFWLTRGNQSVLLKKQSTVLAFNSNNAIAPFITVDDTQKFQGIDGFGYTLTSGSATLIRNMGASQKEALLQELFGNQESSIGVSYLRVSIGASDLSASVYSYNDMPAGQTDPTLANFSLAPDDASGTGLIPLLKEIIAINPGIKILGSPWSPPVWMKSNGSSIGGSLKPEYYEAYAQYFVKYIQQMKAEGITIDAITPQNEPLHDGNNPSLKMTAEEQRDFIKNNLGPAFQANTITTKIIIWDHNCDNPGYPIAILNDPAAKAFIDGSAFHLYAGNIGALSNVKAQHPDKNLYFTEQYTASNGAFEGDFKWHIRNVIIGSMRNWSRNALEWNLANNVSFGPHTQGGCTVCKGALTISGSTVQRNVSYYIIAQIAKFVPPGSIRIHSTEVDNLYTVAFERPDKKKVVLVLNDGSLDATFNLKYKEKWATVQLAANSAGTFIW